MTVLWTERGYDGLQGAEYLDGIAAGSTEQDRESRMRDLYHLA